MARRSRPRRGRRRSPHRGGGRRSARDERAAAGAVPAPWRVAGGRALAVVGSFRTALLDVTASRHRDVARRSVAGWPDDGHRRRTSRSASTSTPRSTGPPRPNGSSVPWVHDAPGCPAAVAAAAVRGRPSSTGARTPRALVAGRHAVRRRRRRPPARTGGHAARSDACVTVLGTAPRRRTRRRAGRPLDVAGASLRFLAPTASTSCRPQPSGGQRSRSRRTMTIRRWPFAPPARPPGEPSSARREAAPPSTRCWTRSTRPAWRRSTCGCRPSRSSPGQRLRGVEDARPRLFDARSRASPAGRRHVRLNRGPHSTLDGRCQTFAPARQVAAGPLTPRTPCRRRSSGRTDEVSEGSGGFGGRCEPATRHVAPTRPVRSVRHVRLGGPWRTRPERRRGGVRSSWPGSHSTTWR